MRADLPEEPSEDLESDLGQLLQAAQDQVRQASVYDPFNQERRGAQRRPEEVHNNHRRLLSQEPGDHLH